MPKASPALRPDIKVNRAVFARISRIHQQVHDQALPNCSTLARQLEVSRKTILRDIEFMRDQLGLPITFDPRLNGYAYTAVVENLPFVNLSEGELVALLVAEKAVAQYAGTPYEQPLKTAFQKIVAQLPARIGVALGGARAVISFRNHGAAPSDLAVFDQVNRATLHGREIEFDYRKLQGGPVERRRLQPYQIACLQQQWYVIGHDLDRKARRTFALSRMSRIKVTERTFTRPADFSLESYLGNSFGVFTGEGNHEVRLRFDDWAARAVAERFWHHTQTVHQHPDGTVELELRVSGFEELERWILSWGRHCEVLEPAELRDRLASTAREIARRHD